MLTTRYYPVFFGPALQARKINGILTDKGLTIKVLTQNNGNKENLDNNVYLKPKFKLKKLYGTKLGLILWSISVCVYILKNRKQIGLIHSLDLYFPTVIFSLLSKLLGIPIFAKNSIEGVYSKKGLIGAFKRFIYRKCTRIISISNETYNELNNDKFPKKKISFIPNGVDRNVFRQVTHNEKMILRNNCNIKESTFVALYTGSISSRKAVMDLVIIWDDFIKKHSNSLLILAGSCTNVEYVNKVKNFISSKKIESSIKIVEHTSDVDLLYKISDIFLFASKNEGLPNSILEALSTGLPVISRNISGCSDLIENGINGYLINSDANFYSEYLDKLLYLYDNPNILKDISKINIAKAELYNIQNIAKKYHELYVSTSRF
jgi:glycosyltransferase involved in cell wall biosynthesis